MKKTKLLNYLKELDEAVYMFTYRVKQENIENENEINANIIDLKNTISTINNSILNLKDDDNNKKWKIEKLSFYRGDNCGTIDFSVMDNFYELDLEIYSVNEYDIENLTERINTEFKNNLSDDEFIQFSEDDFKNISINILDIVIN